MACGETTPSPTPIPPLAVVEPTPQPTVAASGVVTGTVTYRERVALTPDAVVEVALLDVSRAGAPSVTIGEQMIENPGQVPIAFEIEYDPADIDPRFSYAVRAVIKEGDKLAFTTDTRYSVITPCVGCRRKAMTFSRVQGIGDKDIPLNHCLDELLGFVLLHAWIIDALADEQRSANGVDMSQRRSFRQEGQSLLRPVVAYPCRK